MPFIFVIFISVGVIHLFPNINWLNLKPETTSAYLGYNNFWQLQANLDYFTRHVDSPFMHFWYMGILLQFELVFPFLYLLLNKIGKKKKVLPCILLGIFSLVSAFYFGYRGFMESNRMILYYHTLTRVFSIFLGMFIGAIHSSYHPFYMKKMDSRILFFFYLILLILACIFIGADSSYFLVGMIGVTILTARLITYGISIPQDDLSKFDRGIQYFAKITYEIYLVQYPVLFIMQAMVPEKWMQMILIILCTILLSMILHFAFQKKKSFLQILIIILLSFATGFGVYQYILAEDHTEEMKQLEELLNKNEEMMSSKQEEYAKKMKEEEDKLKDALKELENNANDLSTYIHNLPIIGVGDSVMLGASSALYQQFPNGYFDAKVSRTDYEANGILQSIKSQGFLGNPILINLGTNGQCGARCQYAILQTIGDRKLFWINVVNDNEVHVNSGLYQLANDNPNVTIVDWVSASQGHPEYFAVDGIHLTRSGSQVYSETIFNTILSSYEKDIEKQKEQLLKDHESSLHKKITFYGNELLLNAYSSLQEELTDYQVEFHASQDQTIEEIVEEIQKLSESNSFPKHIVLLLDKDKEISKKQIQYFKSLSANVYIVTFYRHSYKNEKNISVIDFSKEIKEHPEYVIVDKVHLSKEGNEALAKIIAKNIS